MLYGFPVSTEHFPIPALIAIMSDRDSRSTDRDALLPGTGYSPDYGINESNDGDDIGSSGSAVPPSVIQSSRTAPKKDRVWVVAMCALIACLASLVNGLMLGFTSPTLDKLNIVTGAQHITNGSKEASLFGVCFFCNTYWCSNAYFIFLGFWSHWCHVWRPCGLAHI